MRRLAQCYLLARLARNILCHETQLLLGLFLVHSESARMPGTSAQRTNYQRSAAQRFPSTRICSRRSITTVKPHLRRKTRSSTPRGKQTRGMPATSTAAGLNRDRSYPVLKVSTATRCHTTSKVPVARNSSLWSLKSSVRTG